MEPDWERLGERVLHRRTTQGWTQEEVWERGGPSDTLQGEIESKKWKPSRSVKGTLQKIDDGMQWVRGSAADVLAGLEPTVIDEERTERRGASIQVDLTTIPGDALLEELRRRMRSDLDYLSSKPVGRWTGLLELVEIEGDEDDVETTTQSDASPEAGQNKEANKSSNDAQGGTDLSRLQAEAEAMGENGRLDDTGDSKKKPG